MVAAATEFHGANQSARNMMPAAGLQYGLFDDVADSVATLSVTPAPVAQANPACVPEALVRETVDQVRTRLCQEAELKAELKMEEAFSTAACDAIIEKLSVTLRRIRNFSDEQLLERALSIPLAN